ncbi:MAG: hypothetical protein FJ319_00200 [SAR202 cluster bacterium]|nr:hypothetical protein [SAR202 cluster bacterium]
MATGGLRSVNAIAGKVVIVADNGTKLELKVTPASKILALGVLGGTTALAAQIGGPAMVEYDTESRALLAIDTRQEGPARGVADTVSNATLAGTLKGVDTVSGTVTVVAEDGAEIVLRATSTSTVMIGGMATGHGVLAVKLGSRVVVDYDARTNTLVRISA